MRLLILFAHPRFEKSRTNKSMLKGLEKDERITFHDLYEAYPDFNVDAEYEKQLLLDHDVIIWHHPFYWYSAPPLLKQWIDIVLEFQWAYGPGGNKLQEKTIFNAISTGGGKDAYTSTGSNRYTVRQFLAPFEQTALLCKMNYLPPFIIQGTHRLSDGDLQHHSDAYIKLIKKIINDEMQIETCSNMQYLNEWLPIERAEQ